jgi:hypothetical protein
MSKYTMIHEAVFREFPAETRRKHTISGRFCQVPVSSGWKRMKPVTGFVHRNTASMKPPELSGTDRFRAGLFDLGVHHVGTNQL